MLNGEIQWVRTTEEPRQYAHPRKSKIMRKATVVKLATTTVKNLSNP